MAGENVVIRYSVMTDQGQGNTDQKKVERGNLTVTLSNGQSYTWAPNQCITLKQPYASEALAFSNLLKEVSRS